MSEVIENIESLSKSASNVGGVLNLVFNRYDRYIALRSDQDAYIRLLYLEILNNIEVLEAIKEEGLAGVRFNDPAFKSLVDQLSIDIMAGVFAPGGKQNQKIFKFLESNGTIHFTTKSGKLDNEEYKEETVIETTVLKTIVFLVTKIEMLKRVSNVGEQEFMKDLRLKTRVKNIKFRLDFLRRKMKEFDNLEKMI